MASRLLFVLLPLLLHSAYTAVTECPSEKCPDQGCRDEDTCECLTRKECEEKYEKYGYIIYAIAIGLIFVSMVVLIYWKLRAPRPLYLQAPVVQDESVTVDQDISQDHLVKSTKSVKSTTNMHQRNASKEMILRDRSIPVDDYGDDYSYGRTPIYAGSRGGDISTSYGKKPSPRYPARYTGGLARTSVIEEDLEDGRQ